MFTSTSSPTISPKFGLLDREVMGLCFLISPINLTISGQGRVWISIWELATSGERSGSHI